MPLLCDDQLVFARGIAELVDRPIRQNDHVRIVLHTPALFQMELIWPGVLVAILRTGQLADCNDWDAGILRKTAQRVRDFRKTFFFVPCRRRDQQASEETEGGTKTLWIYHHIERDPTVIGTTCDVESAKTAAK